jgi:hypothetical protein
MLKTDEYHSKPTPEVDVEYFPFLHQRNIAATSQKLSISNEIE